MEIQSSRHETRNFSTRLLYSAPVLISGLRTKYQFRSVGDGGFGSVQNGYKGKEMLEKMEVGKDTKEYFAKMSKYRKMQDGLRSQMM